MYVPNPPLLRPVTREDSTVPIFVNDSAWLPGPYDQSLPDKPEEAGYILNSYTIGSESTPICIGHGEIYLKTDYQKWLAVVKSTKDDKTSFFLVTALTFLEKKNNVIHYSPPDIPECIMRIGHGIEDWIQWNNCKGAEGHLLINTTEGPIID